MKALYWKIRKGPKSLASRVGEVPAYRNDSLPPLEVSSASGDRHGVPMTPGRETLVNPRHGPVDTEQDTNMNPKWVLTRKVIRRYQVKIQWLVLNP
jgi:hypothetical protein